MQKLTRGKRPYTGSIEKPYFVQTTYVLGT